MSRKTYARRFNRNEHDNNEPIDESLKDSENLESTLEYQEDDFLEEETTRSRSAYDDNQEYVESFRKLKTYPLVILLSILVSFTFKSMPLNPFSPASKVAENLYSGFAMNHGQFPYENFYSNDGIVFFLINQLGNITSDTWVLWGIELFCLIFSSVMLGRLVLKNGGSYKLARISSVFNLLLIFVLAGGGDSSAQFAVLPLIASVDILLDYFKGNISDRRFFLLGLYLSLAVLIMPVVSIFALVAILAYLVQGFRKSSFSRVFYQLMLLILGAMLVVYPACYLPLKDQYLGLAYEQMFVLPFKGMNFDAEGLKTAGIYLLAFVSLFGFKIVSGLKARKPFFLTLVVSAVLTILILAFLPDNSFASLIIILPLVMPFIPTMLKDVPRRKLNLVSYLGANKFLPLVGILALGGYSVWGLVQSVDSYNQEVMVANLIDSSSKSDDKILVIDDGKDIYNLSERVAVAMPVPAYYPAKYTSDFNHRLNEKTAKFIIIDSKKEHSEDLARVLEEAYLQVQSETSSFNIYEKAINTDEPANSANQPATSESTPEASSETIDVSGLIISDDEMPIDTNTDTDIDIDSGN
ncbi:hypothetical protein OZX60_06545 [Streptococcaceae bacterium ESL0687]|nr:hypothetical protein OZX60_06545 [Streptococcaceae bacterium ESL0687]